MSRLLSLLLLLLVFSTPIRSEELDWSKVRNPDPGAHESGILFHPSLQLEFRRLLTEDLAWLHAQGALSESETLAGLVGLGRSQLTGADVVDWIVQYARVVQHGRWCLDDQVVVSGLKPERGIRIYPGDGGKFPCERAKDPWYLTGKVHNSLLDHGNALAHWRQAAEHQRETDGFVIDDHVLVVPIGTSISPPIVHLYPDSLDRSFPTGTPRAARVLRLVVLVHEAHHIQSHSPHYKCADWPLHGPVLLGPVDSTDLDLERFKCDLSYGAYAAGAEFVRVLERNCRECSRQDRQDIKLIEWNEWINVGVPLRKAFPIPNLAALRGTANIVDRLVAHAPPKRFFDAAAEFLRLQGGPAGPDRIKLAEVETLAEILAEHERNGEFLVPWSEPEPAEFQPTVRELRSSASWIRAVQGAAGRGYNVPLTWAPPCSHFPGGCPVARSR